MKNPFLILVAVLAFGTSTTAESNFEQLVDVRLGTIEAILNSLVKRMDAGFFQIDSNVNMKMDKLSTDVHNEILELKNEIKVNSRTNPVENELDPKFKTEMEALNETCSNIKQFAQETFVNLENFIGQSSKPTNKITIKNETNDFFKNVEKFENKLKTEAAENNLWMQALKTEVVNYELFKNGSNCIKGIEINDFGNIPKKDEWIVIQRRGIFQHERRQSFAKKFKDYEAGFGEYSGDFWIGLKRIHALTSAGYTEIKIIIKDWEGVEKFAQYCNFSVSGYSDLYRLHIDGYSGTAGDAMKSHNDHQFTTTDSDNDVADKNNCASLYGQGGWWFEKCFRDGSNLNGIYKTKVEATWEGISWETWKKKYSFKASEMMVRVPKINMN